MLHSAAALLMFGCLAGCATPLQASRGPGPFDFLQPGIVTAEALHARLGPATVVLEGNRTAAWSAEAMERRGLTPSLAHNPSARDGERLASNAVLLVRFNPWGDGTVVAWELAPRARQETVFQVAARWQPLIPPRFAGRPPPTGPQAPPADAAALLDERAGRRLANRLTAGRGFRPDVMSAVRADAGAPFPEAAWQAFLSAGDANNRIMLHPRAALPPVQRAIAAVSNRVESVDPQRLLADRVAEQIQHLAPDGLLIRKNQPDAPRDGPLLEITIDAIRLEGGTRPDPGLWLTLEWSGELRPATHGQPTCATAGIWQSNSKHTLGAWARNGGDSLDKALNEACRQIAAVVARQIAGAD